MRPRRRVSRAPELPGLPASTFRVGEGDLAVQCWSWGSGPTVLLVHGWEGHAGQLARFVPPLVAAGYRAVAFDLPAHSRSAGEGTDLIRASQALTRVAEVTGPVQGVIAHSFGAGVTALALSRGLATSRVALLAAPAEPSLFVRRAAAALGLSRTRTEGMLRRMERQVGTPLAELDMRTGAARLRTPALFLHDPDDTEVPWEHAESTARIWPGAQLVPLTGVGHHRILKDAEAIARAVAFVTGAAPYEETSRGDHGAGADHAAGNGRGADVAGPDRGS